MIDNLQIQNHPASEEILTFCSASMKLRKRLICIHTAVWIPLNQNAT